MPRYQYECNTCGQGFEYRQSFADDPLTNCILCETENSVERVITSVGVIFKGSGFYVNDSKKREKKSNGTSSATDKKSAESKSDTKSETKSEAKTTEKATETKKSD